MTGGREPLSRPSSRHGEARHPLTLTCSCQRRASGQRGCQGKRAHPDGRRWSLPCPCRRKDGACRLFWPAHAHLAAGGRVRAGPPGRTPRPQERAGTARGTVRATSPAHFPRVPDRHPYGPRPWAWFAKRIEQVARRAAPKCAVNPVARLFRLPASALPGEARIFPDIKGVAHIVFVVIVAVIDDQQRHFPPIRQIQSLFPDR